MLHVINLEEEVLEIPDISLFIDILVDREEWKILIENSVMLDTNICADLPKGKTTPSKFPHYDRGKALTV